MKSPNLKLHTYGRLRASRNHATRRTALASLRRRTTAARLRHRPNVPRPSVLYPQYQVLPILELGLLCLRAVLPVQRRHLDDGPRAQGLKLLSEVDPERRKVLEARVPQGGDGHLSPRQRAEVSLALLTIPSIPCLTATALRGRTPVKLQASVERLGLLRRSPYPEGAHYEVRPLSSDHVFQLGFHHIYHIDPLLLATPVTSSILQGIDQRRSELLGGPRLTSPHDERDVVGAPWGKGGRILPLGVDVGAPQQAGTGRRYHHRQPLDLPQSSVVIIVVVVAVVNAADGTSAVPLLGRPQRQSRHVQRITGHVQHAPGVLPRHVRIGRLLEEGQSLVQRRRGLLGRDYLGRVGAAESVPWGGGGGGGVAVVMNDGGGSDLREWFSLAVVVPRRSLLGGRRRGGGGGALLFVVGHCFFRRWRR
mmetsp:Transcript_44864/g.137024  ORF Transcript_44864/g.137024 Transcript_44864/m.137024 type:complete len:421 (-) Transcript_44864:154-1416(-)